MQHNSFWNLPPSTSLYVCMSGQCMYLYVCTWRAYLRIHAIRTSCYFFFFLSKLPSPTSLLLCLWKCVCVFAYCSVKVLSKNYVLASTFCPRKLHNMRCKYMYTVCTCTIFTCLPWTICTKIRCTEMYKESNQNKILKNRIGHVLVNQLNAYIRTYLCTLCIHIGYIT